jgi:hypothetical protein
MAQIQKGTTYSTGDQVTATNLNALADAAILLPGAITDQTAKTVPLAADTVLIHSAADTALRKSTLTQLFSNATGIPISTGISGLGTGIATALAINTGTTGAPALLGAAGAFTTLSASGTATVGQNNTGTGLALLQLFGGSGTNGGSSVYFGTNGTAYSSIGQSSGILGGTSTDFLIYANNGGQSIKFYAGGGGLISTISSTGLAVTGALSSTTGATFATSSGSVGVGTNSPSAKLHVRSSTNTVVELLRLDNAGNSADNGAKITWSNADQAYDAGYISVIRNASLLSQDMVFATSSNWTTTAPSEKVRITGAGNVGIAETSPSEGKLVINNSSGSTNSGVSGNSIYLKAQTSNANLIRFSGAIATDLIIGRFGNADAFSIGTTGGATFATFNSTGIAVTGTVSAIAVGNSGSGAFRSSFNGSTHNGIDLSESAGVSGAGFAQFRKSDGTSIGSITRVTTTDAVILNTSSDGRLKENLRDFTDSGRLIDSLKPRVFDWKNSDENGKNVVGFIAQEEHAADPIFAHIGAVSVGDENPNTVTKQWQRSDSALIPILVAELKSLRQRLAALESK